MWSWMVMVMVMVEVMVVEVRATGCDGCKTYYVCEGGLTTIPVPQDKTKLTFYLHTRSARSKVTITGVAGHPFSEPVEVTLCGNRWYSGNLTQPNQQASTIEVEGCDTTRSTVTYNMERLVMLQLTTTTPVLFEWALQPCERSSPSSGSNKRPLLQPLHTTTTPTSHHHCGRPTLPPPTPERNATLEVLLPQEGKALVWVLGALLLVSVVVNLVLVACVCRRCAVCSKQHGFHAGPGGGAPSKVALSNLEYSQDLDLDLDLDVAREKCESVATQEGGVGHTGPPSEHDSANSLYGYVI